MTNQVLLHSTIEDRLGARVLHATLDTRKFTLYTRVSVERTL